MVYLIYRNIAIFLSNIIKGNYTLNSRFLANLVNGVGGDGDSDENKSGQTFRTFRSILDDGMMMLIMEKQ